jgi:hypothetical protein
MAATVGHRLTLDPMGKCSNAFFSETTPSWISDRHTKHIFCRGPSNDHSWAVWFQLSKWFQRRSVLKHFPHRVTISVFHEWGVLGMTAITTPRLQICQVSDTDSREPLVIIS